MRKLYWRGFGGCVRSKPRLILCGCEDRRCVSWHHRHCHARPVGDRSRFTLSETLTTRRSPARCPAPRHGQPGTRGGSAGRYPSQLQHAAVGRAVTCILALSPDAPRTAAIAEGDDGLRPACVRPDSERTSARLTCGSHCERGRKARCKATFHGASRRVADHNSRCRGVRRLVAAAERPLRPRAARPH